MKQRKNRVFQAAATVVLAGCMSAAEPAQRQPDWHFDGVARVVVVADVHGAFDELASLLHATGIVDGSMNWSGGQTHLVSLGDLLDRGGKSRAVMDLLMRLQDQAPATGGAVHVVMGNHEHMNLIGDLRYVARDEFAAFANDETSQMRELARSAFEPATPEMTAEERAAAFEARYPPGYFAHRAAFRPDGRYGRWLLSLPVVVIVNDTAFVHGGLPMITSGWTAAQLNKSFGEDLRLYLHNWRRLVDLGALPDDEPGSSQLPDISAEMIEDPSTCIEDRAFACEKIEGNAEVQTLMEKFILTSAASVNGYQAPFWYRGSVYCRDILERPILDRYLDTLGASRVVVGHTVTPDHRVRAIRDGKLIMADTGMLVSYYKGRPAALEIKGAELLVHYLDSNEQRPPEPGYGPVAWGLPEQEFQTALKDGLVTAVKKDPQYSYWRVTLDYKGKRVAARFFPGGRNGGADKELAADALDELLGTELVAATVPRRLDDTNGALQIAYTHEVSEAQRISASLGFDGWCDMQDQYQLMYMFDLLTANAGRTADNILYRRNPWSLLLTDHGNAFNRTSSLPKGLPDNAIALAPPVASALAGLNLKLLQSAVGDHLNKRRIKALLSRRDKLLEKFR